MKEEEEKCCGNCCWFCFEDTDGEGQCMRVGYRGSLYGAFTYCCTPPCKHYDSRDDMRHHMAVLLQACRWHDSTVAKRPDGLFEAAAFAYKYMKTFSEL
jgi:hypothetical protein